MTSSRRFDPLLRRAQEREDSAARELAERQHTLSQHETRLQELRSYLNEYTGAPLATASPAQLANQRAFLDRLDAAVQQQCQNVDRSRASVDLERNRLLLASRDKQVLEKLAASYRVQERQASERRDQRELDDLGARGARQRALAESGSTG